MRGKYYCAESFVMFDVKYSVENSSSAYVTKHSVELIKKFNNVNMNINQIRPNIALFRKYLQSVHWK